MNINDLASSAQVGLLINLIREIKPYYDLIVKEILIIPKNKQETLNLLEEKINSTPKGEVSLTIRETYFNIEYIKGKLKYINTLCEKGVAKKITTPKKDFGITVDEGMFLFNNGRNVIDGKSIARLIMKHDNMDIESILKLGDIQMSWEELETVMLELAEEDGFDSVEEGVKNFKKILEIKGEGFVEKRKESSKLYNFFLMLRQVYQYSELRKLEHDPQIMEDLCLEEYRETFSKYLEEERAMDNSPGFIQDYMNNKTIIEAYKPEKFLPIKYYISKQEQKEKLEKELSDKVMTSIEDGMDSSYTDNIINSFTEKIEKLKKKLWGLKMVITDGTDDDDALDNALKKFDEYMGRMEEDEYINTQFL